MTYYHNFRTLPCADLAHVRRFLRDNGARLAKAAHRLGGSAASARVFLLCEAVSHTRRLTQTQRRQLVDLHQTLTLDHVGDPNRIETALFAVIDPESPFVEDCCLLSEKLGALLRLIAESDPFEQEVCPEGDAPPAFA